MPGVDPEVGGSEVKRTWSPSAEISLRSLDRRWRSSFESPVSNLTDSADKRRERRRVTSGDVRKLGVNFIIGFKGVPRGGLQNRATEDQVPMV
jgi:hypothetical protein